MTGEQFTGRETLERMLLIARGAEEGEDVLDALIDMREPLEAALAGNPEPSPLKARYREAIDILRIADTYGSPWRERLDEFLDRAASLVEHDDYYGQDEPTADPCRAVLGRVFDILEQTYQHDEEGNRTNGLSPISGADVTQMLMDMEHEIETELKGKGR